MLIKQQRILGVIVLIALLIIGVAILLHRQSTHLPIVATNTVLPAEKPPMTTNVFEQQNSPLMPKAVTPVVTSPDMHRNSSTTSITTTPTAVPQPTTVPVLIQPKTATQVTVTKQQDQVIQTWPKRIHHTPAVQTTKSISMAKSHEWQTQTGFPHQVIQAGWLVQVGSFKSDRDAKRLAKQLRTKNFTVMTQKIYTTQHGAMTRVIVGQSHLTRAAALKLQQQIQQRAKITGFLTHLHLAVLHPHQRSVLK